MLPIASVFGFVNDLQNTNNSDSRSAIDLQKAGKLIFAKFNNSKTRNLQITFAN